MSGTAKYDEAIDTQVAENFLVPAERVLANKDVFTINVELLEKDMAAWLTPQPAAVEVKPDESAQLQPEKTDTVESAAAPVPEQSEPDPVVEPLSTATESAPTRAEAFPMLVLNRCQHKINRDFP